MGGGGGAKENIDEAGWKPQKRDTVLTILKQRDLAAPKKKRGLASPRKDICVSIIRNWLMITTNKERHFTMIRNWLMITTNKKRYFIMIRNWLIIKIHKHIV